MGTGADAGTARAVEALLRSNGGFSVLLRLPGNAVSGSDAEQLGLSTPIFQEIPVGPAVWRKTGSVAELLLAAPAVTALVGSGSNSSAQSLFQSAVGVIVDGVVYGIEEARPVGTGNGPCAYVLAVQAPSWQ